MMMKMMMGAAVLLGLVTFGPVSVEASELNDPGDEIVVVNRSVTPVQVYMEDSEGRRHQLGSVSQGQATTFQAPEGIVEQGDFRVVVRPGHYSQFSRNQVSIKTRALTIEDDETVILWLDRELSQSKVQIQ
jgi:hypothetical protein